MLRATAPFFYIFAWLFISFTILLSLVWLTIRVNQTNNFPYLFLSASRNVFDSPSKIPGETINVLAAVKAADARPVLIDRFLAKHNSPMIGQGETFVEIADQYGLDWKLLPAIAFQESSLGKKIPDGSYNPFGWAIYSGERSGAEFENWKHSIEIVARGLKTNYFSQGLTTPEKIMTKYTPNSNGSWAVGVRFAMGEIIQ
ncbi:MAG: hypothetical protein A2864_01620 [Candidatus Woykebacteria bacterium RIFCSPHIGHO2_01_FULL_39_12]|uniref:Mannosyl-glycoprotein endo-beta-N-acetylglucosamidase-like domain-containing protein n=1 Tax=Candidatus Woykebacteria bacterium RIFCSPHIGHO2_01_FULL_39_12 TaxID=1802599 RepID=A0A1G1WHJ6_9BACT|nr:MAG: hypothetical protein A2864_01620 [Candidatus Woykebacteria bacterium RIFCSPHIGHO2_01_FULL_39_12]